MNAETATAHAAIRDAMARYCRALDDRRLEDLAGVFDETTVFTMQDGEVAVGAQAAIEALARRVEVAPRHRHLVSSVVLDVRGDQATAISDWYLVMPSGQQDWFVHSTGTYEDELRYEGGRWVFSSRTIRPAPR